MTLDVGTLGANIKRAGTDLSSEVLTSLREAVRLAADTKRSCQRLIGCFIESLMTPGVFQESDRELLDHICPRIPATIPDGDGEDQGEDDDEDGTESTQALFIGMLLRFLLSDNRPWDTTVVGKVMSKFLTRVQNLGLLAGKRTLRPDYPGAKVLESVGREICREFKKIYIHGSKALRDEVRGAFSEHGKASVPIPLNLYLTSSILHDSYRSATTRDSCQKAPTFQSTTRNLQLRILFVSIA